MLFVIFNSFSDTVDFSQYIYIYTLCFRIFGAERVKMIIIMTEKFVKKNVRDTQIHVFEEICFEHQWKYGDLNPFNTE